MLADLAAARSDQLDRISTIASRAADLPDHMRDHLDRVSRLSVEVASLNTILRWGWIKNERLVKVGAGILDRLTADPSTDPDESDA